MAAQDDSQDDANGGIEDESVGGCEQRRKLVEKHKLIIVMVGLPGRGKTFLCNKLCSYLNWLGHRTRHFNVGFYRRRMNTSHEAQDATFFDKNNQDGQQKRQEALLAALDDMLTWLGSEHSQVAIFDATNSTEERRRFLIQKFHGTYQYLFLESVCNDPAVLEANYRYKMMFSPDYKGVDVEQAMVDFKERILRYEEVYETITDRNIHYIKLINMVTGRGHLDINRISGYIPGKIVFFLMQICKSGMARTRKIWLSRHGESQYNVLGLLGGDSGISDQGHKYAEILPDIIFDRLPLSFDESACPPVCVWTSTLKRTIETAGHLPFPKLRWKALDEIHAGQFDSYTYEQIQEKYPEEYKARKENKLSYRYPNGESYLDVIQRLEPVIIELEREKESVVVIAHQAILRALYGYYSCTPLTDIPTLEIPLHTVIELTPKADGTMTEERFETGVPTTKQIDEVAAAVAAAAGTKRDTLEKVISGEVPVSPHAAPGLKKQAVEVGADMPMGNAGDAAAAVHGILSASPPTLNMPVGSLPNTSSIGMSPAVVPPRSASSLSLAAANAGGGMVKSLSELRLANSAAANRPSLHIPALNQSMQWAESASHAKGGDTGASTSDEGPTSDSIIKHRLQHH